MRKNVYTSHNMRPQPSCDNPNVKKEVMNFLDTTTAGFCCNGCRLIVSWEKNTGLCWHNAHVCSGSDWAYTSCLSDFYLILLYLHWQKDSPEQLLLLPHWKKPCFSSALFEAFSSRSRQETGRGASWEQYAEVNTAPSVCYIMAGAAQSYHPHYTEWAWNKKAKAACEPFCDNPVSGFQRLWC